MMMNFNKIFQAIDEKLTQKNRQTLTDKEKNVLNQAYTNILFQHHSAMGNRQDLSEYALNKQLQHNLANMTFDVLKQMRPNE
jgi:hypothetical protein